MFLDASGNGTAYAQNNDMNSANDVNNGSSDNCYLDLIYSISTDGGMNFFPSINFNCSNIGTPISVILKVKEDGGALSSNSMPCFITVVDNVKPLSGALKTLYAI